jgi:alpha-beta hydrolase superfamily lysophospholipase
MISLFAKRAKATTAKMSKKKGEEEPPHASQGIKIPLDSTGRPFTAKEFNKPDSGLYFRNDRGQRIHTRRWLPASAAEAKGVIFYFHGYGGHCNNGEKEEMAAAFTSAGFAVFMLDAHGHGYSDGERVFLKDWQHLVDDAMLYANLVLNYGAAEEAAGGRDVNLGIDVNLWGEFLKSAPFAFMGHSLGGAVAILTSSM